MVLGLPCLPIYIPGGAAWPRGCRPCLLLQGHSPGTMLGEAKGTAWPESCWSFVTYAKEEGSEVRGGLVSEGVPGATVTHLSGGHSPILTLDGKALWGQSGGKGITVTSQSNLASCSSPLPAPKSFFHPSPISIPLLRNASHPSHCSPSPGWQREGRYLRRGSDDMG